MRLLNTQGLAEPLKPLALHSITADDDAEVVAGVQPGSGLEQVVHTLPRDEASDCQDHWPVGKVQPPFELQAVVRRRKPGQIDALLDYARAVDGCAQRHAAVTHEGTEIERAVRTRQQTPDGAVVIGCVPASVVHVSVDQDVGATQASNERPAGRRGGERTSETARPAEVTVDDVDLLRFDDLGSEPFNRHRAVELARVPDVGPRNRRGALERKSEGLGVVDERVGSRQRSEPHRARVIVSRRLRREHVGLHAGRRQADNLLVEKCIGGELPGPLGLWYEIEDFHLVELR